MDRVHALTERLPVDLVLRPVLPMVMRGLPVPREKRLYITLDTKREAEDAGVAFGRICDPVGRPVERCFSLYPWATQRGRAGALLRSFTQAAFAEGVDTGSDAGLRLVVERAGLSWQEAAAQLDRDGWQPELEANRVQLFALGLWGVPSFRLLGAGAEPDYSTWGQDRLWRVEQEIRRRLSGVQGGGAAAPQAYVIYPLIEESEKSDLQAAIQGAAQLQQGELAEFRVGLLQGRMKAAEKESVMADFKAGVVQVLVATTVVESASMSPMRPSC